MLGRTLLSLALIACLAGCRRRQETVAPPAKPWNGGAITKTPPSQEDDPADENRQPHQGENEQREPEVDENEPADANDPAGADAKEPSAAGSEDLPGTRTYNTGDCDDWPSCDLPLVIEIEVPEFPEWLTRRAEPIPDEEE
jgi:hypothetical protein